MRIFNYEDVKRESDEKKYFIFHHNDLDGYASAGLIIKHLANGVKANLDDIYTIPCMYDKRWYIDKYVQESDTVYIVDYSFKQDEDMEALKRAYEITSDITWIDHHLSSYRIMEKDPFFYELAKKGLVDDTFCASILTYLYLLGADHNALIIYDDNRYKRLIDEYKLPKWLLLTDVHDTHYIKYLNLFENAEWFNAGSRYYNWHTIFTDTDVQCRHYYFPIYNDTFEMAGVEDTIISTGQILYTHDYRNAKNAVTFNGFKADIVIKDRIYKCLCVNRMGPSSMFDVDDSTDTTGRDLFDAFVAYIFDGKAYKYSIYSLTRNYSSMETDVSKISEYFCDKYKLNGGGHKHAAGFSTPEQILTNIRPGTNYYED